MSEAWNPTYAPNHRIVPVSKDRVSKEADGPTRWRCLDCDREVEFDNLHNCAAGLVA